MADAFHQRARAGWLAGRPETSSHIVGLHMNITRVKYMSILYEQLMFLGMYVWQPLAIKHINVKS